MTKGKSIESLPVYVPQFCAVAFDLFGTLVMPPSSRSFQKQFRSVWRTLPAPLLRYIGAGFPGALVVHEMGLDLNAAVQLNITRPIGSAAELADELRAKWPETKTPHPQTLSLADEITDFAVQGVRLAISATSVLEDLAARGITLQLFSDTSLPFSRVVEQLALSRWFPDPVFSFKTGRLKRDGSAFRAVPHDERVCWTMVGDDWRSDVLGSLRAGWHAVLVDRSRCHPGRQLVEDLGPFLAATANRLKIRVAEPFRSLLPHFLPISLRTLEKRAARHCKITPDGQIRLLAFEHVHIIESLSTLEWELG